YYSEPEVEYYEDEYYAEPYPQETRSRSISVGKPQPVQVIFGLVAIMLVGLLFVSRPLTEGVVERLARNQSGVSASVNTNGTSAADQVASMDNQPAPARSSFWGRGSSTSTGRLAPFFSPSVLYWEQDIVRWADNHNLNPNMVATVMQIESCGDPRAVSSAGAMGLFQVMPFHFQAGEDGFDPDTNALRGMNYLAERLIQTGGEIGHAFAGYNGGQAAAASTWSNWANETQRYYRWTTGVYSDALNGNSTSETLEQWYVAGGTSLCNQAEQRLGIN
ncbi:MAG: transglycosylase SLT domain-containing protein, partial [Chloroflexota bacterium]